MVKSWIARKRQKAIEFHKEVKFECGADEIYDRYDNHEPEIHSLLLLKLKVIVTTYNNA